MLGCSGTAPTGAPPPPAPANDAAVDAAVDAEIDAAPAGFLSDQSTTLDGGDVIVDDVTYLSGSLVVHGVVCRPSGAGAHPLVMLNHGGFVGIDADTRVRSACTGLAQLGIVGAMSSYRGEDGSDGAVEVCLGEVDDVLAMKNVLVQQPWIAPDRVATVGFSHGACIATRMALRDPTLRAAVDFFGPADVAAAYDFWQTQLDQGEPFCASTGQTGCESMHSYLVGAVKAATKGTPAEQPAAYAARSPAPTLAKLTVPIMIFQGTYDYAIDTSQACTKRSLLAPRTWYLDAKLAVATPGAPCGGQFESGPLPTSFPDPAYLFFYEGQGHGFDDGAYASAGQLAFEFLTQRL